MKRFAFLRIFMALSLAFFAITQSVQAQFTLDASAVKSAGELSYQFTGTLDTLSQTNDTLTSKAFSLADYDGGTTFTYASKYTSVKGLPKVTSYLMGSEDGKTFVNLDTLSTADSSETQKYTKFDINSVRAKFYKVKLLQTARGRDNSLFDVKIRAWKRDY